MPDPLAAVLRLRRLAADEARLAFAAATRGLHAAETLSQNAAQRLFAEAAIAPPNPGDALAGQFAAWLPAALEAKSRADAATHAAEGASSAARAAMVAAKAALEAAEALADTRAAVGRRKAGRRAQAALDDAALRRSRLLGE